MKKNNDTLENKENNNISEKEQEFNNDELSTTQENKDDVAETQDNDTVQQKEKTNIFGKKSSKDAKLKEKIENLEDELKELNDRYLRLFSEFDNYKKRTSKEKLELLVTASETVIANLLPIIDDFERAIQANQEVDNIASVKEGFEVIYKKMLQVLKHFNVEEIPAKDEIFDTDFHEAVTHFPTDNEEDKGKVIEVLNKGYKIKDKVIRFSKVVVAN